MIPAPAPDGVPCSPICGHADCASARLVATAPCVRCRQLIGYDRPFRRLSGGFALLEHVDCPPRAVHDALCIDPDNGKTECVCGLNDSPYPGDPR